MAAKKPKAEEKLPVGLRRLPSGSIQWRVRKKLPDGRTYEDEGTVLNGDIEKAVFERAASVLKARNQRYTPDTNLTLDAYAADWLDRRTATISWSLDRGHRSQYTHHISPVLGKATLKSLTPRDIQRLYDGLCQVDPRNPKRQGKPLSTVMLKQISGLIKMMLNDAVTYELIDRNPAAAIKPNYKAARTERGEKKKTKAWSPQEAQRFYAVARQDRMGRVFLFQLLTGMRIGEVLGLRRENVDLETGVVNVFESLQSRNGRRHHGPTKTEDSHRTVRVNQQALEILRELDVQRRVDREAHPSRYQDSDAVFTNTLGNFILNDTVYRAMKRLCSVARVPYRGTHVARHTFVSTHFRLGYDREGVSKYVGHSDPEFTARVYRKVLEEELLEMEPKLYEETSKGDDEVNPENGHEMGMDEDE